ncbi:MAG: class I SAM-dependent methyltransferase [Acidobacteria bacterium]|nr:class I SAM-dependent methyltransferase [Acidobacteriota bacterium]
MTASPGSTVIRARPRSGPLVRLLANQVVRYLSFLEKGTLVVVFPDGSVRSFGRTPSPAAELRIERGSFFRRVVLGGEIGLGDAYVRGEWRSPDPSAVLRVFIENEPILMAQRARPVWVTRLTNRVGFRVRAGTVLRRRRPMRGPFDLDYESLRPVLDETMSMTSGVWLDPAEDLEQAQRNRMQALIRKARLAPGVHLLDIGSGWGGLAMEAARSTGCRVTAVTLSPEQLEYTRRRVLRTGLSQLVEVRLADYREIGGPFDRIVSTEMLEFVGHESFGVFFETCDRLLAPEGLLVLQVITIPDQRYEAHRMGVDWVQKQLFPAMGIPSLNMLTEAMTRWSSLTVENLENIGPHFARTLREWSRRLAEAGEPLRGAGWDERRRRTFEYLLAYGEAAFATRNLNLLQLVLTRPNNTTLGSDVALDGRQSDAGSR